MATKPNTMPMINPIFTFLITNPRIIPIMSSVAKLIFLLLCMNLLLAVEEGLLEDGRLITSSQNFGQV